MVFISHFLHSKCVFNTFKIIFLSASYGQIKEGATMSSKKKLHVRTLLPDYTSIHLLVLSLLEICEESLTSVKILYTLDLPDITSKV
jgi:hypothetical protein